MPEFEKFTTEKLAELRRKNDAAWLSSLKRKMAPEEYDELIRVKRVRCVRMVSAEYSEASASVLVYDGGAPIVMSRDEFEANYMPQPEREPEPAAPDAPPPTP